MATGLRVGPIFYKIGTGSLLHSFFSTIAYHLEDNKWGSKFPFLMNELYQGDLSLENIPKVKKELNEIRAALREFGPDGVIWDIDDLKQHPPWGENIAESITSLSDYFITSDGRQFFDVFEKALQTGIDIQKPIRIQSL